MQFHKREQISRILESCVNPAVVCKSAALVAKYAQHNGVLPLEDIISLISQLLNVNINYSISVEDAVAACRYSYFLSPLLVASPIPAIRLNFQLFPSTVTITNVPHYHYLSSPLSNQTTVKQLNDHHSIDCRTNNNDDIDSSSNNNREVITIEKIRLYIGQLVGFSNLIKIEKLNNKTKQGNTHNSTNNTSNLNALEHNFKVTFNRPETALVFWRAVKYVPLFGKIFLNIESYSEPFKIAQKSVDELITGGNNAINKNSVYPKNNNNNPINSRNNYSNNNNRSRGGSNQQQRSYNRNRNNTNNNIENYRKSDNRNYGAQRSQQAQHPVVVQLKISRRQAAPLLIENRLNINVTQ